MNTTYVKHSLATLKQLRHTRFDDSNYPIKPGQLDANWDLDDYTVCPGLNLQHVFLRGKCTPSALFDDVSFAGATFEGCDFTDVEAKGCDFTGCSFHDCVLTGMSFTECSLLGAKFDGCYMVGVDFEASFTGPSRNVASQEAKTCSMHICNSILSEISCSARKFAHVHGNVLIPLRVVGRVISPSSIKATHARLTGNVKPAGSSSAVISCPKVIYGPAQLPLLSTAPTLRNLLGPAGSSYTPGTPADKKATLICSAQWRAST